MDDQADERSRDEVLGPPLCRIFERSALGPLPPNAPPPPSLRGFARRASMMLRWCYARTASSSLARRALAHDTPLVPKPGQSFHPLGPEDEARLREQRAVVERLFEGDDDTLRKYATSSGKLGVLRAALGGNVFQPSQTYELQCLGIVLGDVLASELGMVWRMVEDEHGRDPCLVIDGTSIVLFPLTMISKRIERGEQVDVFDLFNGVADDVGPLKADPDVG
jgi:hypothetical protein